MKRRNFPGAVASAGTVLAIGSTAGPAVRTASAATKKSIENTPVMLECAINGSTTRARNPFVPETPSEQAAEIIDAVGRPVVTEAEASKYLDIPFAATQPGT
jgi:hypothetical protein